MAERLIEIFRQTNGELAISEYSKKDNSNEWNSSSDRIRYAPHVLFYMGTDLRDCDIYEFKMVGFSDEEIIARAPEIVKQIAEGQNRRRDFVKKLHLD